MSSRKRSRSSSRKGTTVASREIHKNIVADTSLKDGQFRQICMLSGATPHDFFTASGEPCGRRQTLQSMHEHSRTETAKRNIGKIMAAASVVGTGALALVSTEGGFTGTNVQGSILGSKFNQGKEAFSQWNLARAQAQAQKTAGTNWATKAQARAMDRAIQRPIKIPPRSKVIPYDTRDPRAAAFSSLSKGTFVPLSKAKATAEKAAAAKVIAQRDAEKYTADRLLRADKATADRLMRENTAALKKAQFETAVAGHGNQTKLGSGSITVGSTKSYVGSAADQRRELKRAAARVNVRNEALRRLRRRDEGFDLAHQKATQAYAAKLRAQDPTVSTARAQTMAEDHFKNAGVGTVLAPAPPEPTRWQNVKKSSEDFAREHKNALIAVGAVAVLYAGIRLHRRNQNAKIMKILKANAVAAADGVSHHQRAYRGQLEDADSALHAIFGRGASINGLRKALLVHQKGWFRGRSITVEHLIRRDGNVRTSAGEIADAILANHSWWNVGENVGTKLANMFTRRKKVSSGRGHSRRGHSGRSHSRRGHSGTARRRSTNRARASKRGSRRA
jgi:hypothetical protein